MLFYTRKKIMIIYQNIIPDFRHQSSQGVHLIKY